METIKIWEGRRGAKNGCDDSDVQVVEFVGRDLGYLRTSEDPWDNRGIDYRIFQCCVREPRRGRQSWMENGFGKRGGDPPPRPLAAGVASGTGALT